MPEFVPMLALAALVLTFTNFLKYAKAGDLNGALTILVVWAAGVGAVVLGAHTDFAGGFVFGDVALEKANLWTQVFVGLNIGSAGTALNEFKQAFDRSDSAVKPKLVGPPAGPVVVRPKVD